MRSTVGSVDSPTATSATRHSGFVVAAVLVLAVLIWEACLYSLTGQIGQAFPGFFSGFTPRDFTGWPRGPHCGCQRPALARPRVEKKF